MGGAQTDRQPQPSGKGGHAGPCSAEAGVWEGSLGGVGRGQDLLSQGGGGWVACGGKGCGPRRPALPYLLANLKDRFLQRQTEEKGDVGGEGRGPGQSHPPPPHPEGGRCPGTPSPPPQMGRGSAGGSRHLGGSNPPHLPTPVTPSHMGRGGGDTHGQKGTQKCCGGGVSRGDGRRPGGQEEPRGTQRGRTGAWRDKGTHREAPPPPPSRQGGGTRKGCVRAREGHGGTGKSPGGGQKGTWRSPGGGQGDTEKP